MIIFLLNVKNDLFQIRKLYLCALKIWLVIANWELSSAGSEHPDFSREGHNG